MAPFIIIHFRFDWLYIYDGDSVFAESYHELTGNYIPSNITTTGPEAVFHFQSDSSEVASGFKIHYDASNEF